MTPGDSVSVDSPASARSSSVVESSTSTQVDCLWQQGKEACRFSTTDPDILFAHLSADHIGRKSTNNLVLTCQWQGTCGVQCLKRDHIISHLRVHVPLTPHRCALCAKAFKRPQDLRKHEKIHTEAHHLEHRHSKAAVIESQDERGNEAAGGGWTNGIKREGSSDLYYEPAATTAVATVTSPAPVFLAHEPNQAWTTTQSVTTDSDRSLSLPSARHWTTGSLSIESRESTGSPLSSNLSDFVDSPYSMGRTTSPTLARPVQHPSVEQVLGNKRPRESINDGHLVNQDGHPVYAFDPGYVPGDFATSDLNDILNLQDIKRHKFEATYDGDMENRLDMMGQLLALDDATFAQAIGLDLSPTLQRGAEPLQTDYGLPTPADDRRVIPSAKDFEDLSTFLSQLESNIVASQTFSGPSNPALSTFISSEAPYSELPGAAPVQHVPFPIGGGSMHIAPGECAIESRHPSYLTQSFDPMTTITYPTLPYPYQAGPYRIGESHVAMPGFAPRDAPRFYQRAELLTRARPRDEEDGLSNVQPGGQSAQPVGAKSADAPTSNLYPNLDTLATVAALEGTGPGCVPDKSKRERPSAILTGCEKVRRMSPPLASPVSGLAESLDDLAIARARSARAFGSGGGSAGVGGSGSDTTSLLSRSAARCTRHHKTVQGMLTRLDSIKIRLQAMQSLRQPLRR